MKAIHYDMRNIREIEVISLKRVDGDFIKTDKGLLFAGEIFPTAMKDQLAAHFNEIREARRVLANCESKMYQLMNQAAPWRNV